VEHYTLHPLTEKQVAMLTKLLSERIEKTLKSGPAQEAEDALLLRAQLHGRRDFQQPPE
jgi:hypothetical protein